MKRNDPFAGEVGNVILSMGAGIAIVPQYGHAVAVVASLMLAQPFSG